MILAMVRAGTVSSARKELQQSLEAVCRTTSGLGYDLFQKPTEEDDAMFVVRWTDPNGADRARLDEVMDVLTDHCERVETELHTVSDTARNKTATANSRKVGSPIFSTPGRLFEVENARGLEQPAVRDDETVRAVESYIRLHFDEDLSVADLAAIAGVSARTLFRNFRTHRGRSPMKVVEAARLEYVRQRLLDGGRQDSVTRIASDAGFTHLGRFSGLYKGAYGETPSETLRSSQQRRRLGEPARNRLTSTALGRKAS